MLLFNYTGTFMGAMMILIFQLVIKSFVVYYVAITIKFACCKIRNFKVFVPPLFYGPWFCDKF